MKDPFKSLVVLEMLDKGNNENKIGNGGQDAERLQSQDSVCSGQ